MTVVNLFFVWKGFSPDMASPRCSDE